MADESKSDPGMIDSIRYADTDPVHKPQFIGGIYVVELSDGETLAEKASVTRLESEDAGGGKFTVYVVTYHDAVTGFGDAIGPYINLDTSRLVTWEVVGVFDSLNKVPSVPQKISWQHAETPALPAL